MKKEFKNIITIAFAIITVAGVNCDDKRFGWENQTRGFLNS